MGLDVFVMPLWKFKVGDFTPPIEAALGIRPKVATPEGIADGPGSEPVSFWARWRAKREVAAIRRSVAKANPGASIRWRDDGPAVFERQCPAFSAIRAFALWLDGRDRLPAFDAPPEGDYHKHPAFELAIEHPSCPHLVGHGLHNGYFLPADFATLGDVEPYLIFNHWPASHPVGSTPRLLRELDLIRSHLPASPPGDDGPLAPVRRDHDRLREAAELSHRHGLPIIFWG